MAGRGNEQDQPQIDNPRLERVIKRINLGFEEMKTNMEEFMELTQPFQNQNGGDDEATDEGDEDEPDQEHVPGGQGRVRNPNDGRLKKNRG